MLILSTTTLHAFTHDGVSVDFKDSVVVYDGQEYQFVELVVKPHFLCREIQYRTVDKDNKMVVFFLYERTSDRAKRWIIKKFKN